MYDGGRANLCGNVLKNSPCHSALKFKFEFRDCESCAYISDLSSLQTLYEII
jgi:hypothetical protein